MNTIQKNKALNHFAGNYQDLFNCNDIKVKDCRAYAFLAQYFYNNVVERRFVSCKESFNTLIWSTAYQNEKNLPEFIFYIGKAQMETFVWLMKLVHKQWRMAKFQYVISDCGNMIYVSNSFWRQNVAHTEILSIFAKLCKFRGNLFNKNAKDIRGALPKFNVPDQYNYLTQEILHCLDIGKTFVREIYGLDPKKDYKEIYSKLFSFGCNGLVTSLRDIAKTQPEKFQITQ